ncbi:MAG: hypothetical protein N3D74_01525 [Caldisericia bacterium]|nr:hypothetical protein [Caldisericia bacterium]
MKKKKVSLRDNYLKTINEIIKGELFPFYILLGDNFYLKNQLLEKIKVALKVEKINIIDGEIDKKTILDYLESSSFFFSSLLFYIKDADKIEDFKWEDFSSRKNRIIIFESKEGKIPEPPLYLEEKVKYVFDEPLEENVLKKWVLKKFDENGKKIDEKIASKMIFELQGNLDLLYTEIEKLSLLENETITEEDIDYFTYKINIPSIYEIIASYLKGRKRKFLNLLNDLIQTGEPFERIFYLLLNRIINLIDIKIANIKGVSEKNIRESLKLSPFQISSLTLESKEYSFEELFDFLKDLLEIEKSIKLSKGYLKEKLELDSIKR